MKLTYGDRVEVEWEDASSQGSWMDEESVAEYLDNPPIMSTIGFLLHYDKKVVMLAATMAPDGTTAGTWRLPGGMIRSVKKLAPPAARKRKAA